MAHYFAATKHNKAPEWGWRSSPPACTAYCGLPAIAITT